MGALFSWRWANGFMCPMCEHAGYWRLQSCARYQCRGCRHHVSPTAGAILASTKLPRRTWFLAMFRMTHTKNGISALELSRQLGVTYNTAWSVKHSLTQVMKDRDDPPPLRGWVHLYDAYWGGERRRGRCGRGSPSKTPLVAAVQLNRQGPPVWTRVSHVGAFQSEEITAWAKCHVEPDTLVFSDAWGCFSAAQRAGCFHQPFVTGCGPSSAQHPALSWVNTIPGNIERSLHSSYHYVSSKRLPRYLPEFSYRLNRRFSLRGMFPRLAYVTLRTPPIPNRFLKWLRIMRIQDSSEIVSHARRATFVLMIVCIVAVVASYIRDTDRLERAVSELDLSLNLIDHIHKNSPNRGPYPLDQVIMGLADSDSGSVSHYQLTLKPKANDPNRFGTDNCELTSTKPDGFSQQETGG